MTTSPEHMSINHVWSGVEMIRKRFVPHISNANAIITP